MEDKTQNAVEKTVEAVKATCDVIQIIENWWSQHIHDSPISQNTHIFNYMQEAKNILLNALRES